LATHRDEHRGRRRAPHDRPGPDDGVTTVRLDTHVVHWWSAEPGRLSERPADRLIDATAVVRGYPLVTQDRRLRDHPEAGDPTAW
jgi:PIN domain nuclease of toxin-antitoxin system